MTDPKFEFTRNQRYLRGLLFLAAGVFLLLRFAAGDNNLFFLTAAWLAGLVALVALVLFLWTIYSRGG